MKKFKRRSFTGSVARFEQQEEAPPLDLHKDPVENMKELLTEITRKDAMPTGKRMGYLNNFAQLVRCAPPDTDFGFSLQDIISCLKVAFVSPAKEIRAAGLRALRHFLQTPEQAKAVVTQRMDILIARSMDMQPSFEVERVQALRLARKMIYLCAEEFPMSLAMSLAAISADFSQNRDRMSRACLATICELAIKNVKIASFCGAVNVIISNILDCPVPRMNESLIVTLLYLFNTPKYRCFLRRSVGLEAILAPFTDLYYRHNSDIPESAILEDQKNRIDAAKLALVTIFRSWPGIICMCDAEGNGLESLMGVFRLPNTDMRAGIIETLFDVFCLRKPILTDDFYEALNSCDPSYMQSSWKLCEGFVVEEALSLLKHRASGNRTNLVQSYVALVLNAFIDADLLESLVDVITTSDDGLSIRATILLGELLHMANTLLPPECSGSCSGHTHCLPSLMSLATNLEVSSSKRGKASAAIGYLDQIHHVKKRGTVPCSLFLEQILCQASNRQGKYSKSFKDKADQTILRDSEDILSAIKESQVLSGVDFLFDWDWDLTSAVLDSPKLSIKRQEDPTHMKFVRRLLQFYKPSNKQYCLVEVEHESARNLSEVGLQLVDFLLRREEQPDGERLLLELVQEISDALTEATSTGHTMGVFAPGSVNDTLARDYFLFIGRLSSTPLGTRCLERTSGVFQHLLEICSMCARENMLKLILASFDYGKDGIARVILAKALTASPLSSRLYATKFMRVLLRAKTQYFSNWGMELLTNQLYDQETDVVAEAIDVLQEACEDEANLQRLIEIRPALLHLGEKGVILLVRYLSVSRGFTYLSEVDYVEPLLDAWKNAYNLEYVHWIENELGEALTLFQRHADNDNYIRRSSSERISNKDVFVIPHLYGELSQHRMGITIIQDKGFLRDSVNTILDRILETPKDIHNMKAALWALGHIGSTSWGIALLSPVPRLSTPGEVTFLDEDDSVMEEEDIDIIREIAQMAQDCEVLTVRGTCFYALGLIAKTSQGADRLEALGWECVRHRGAETWPIIEQEVAYLADDYVSDEELQRSESGDEAEDNQNGPSSGAMNDRFGGVYLGDEVSDFSEPYHSEAFEYTRITLGEDGKKYKGKKRSPEDEKYNDQEEKRALSDFKTRTFNVDESGNLTEQSLSLMSGLERLVLSEGTAGIFLGEDDTAMFSKNNLRTDIMQTLSNLEKQQTTKSSSSEPNLSQTVKSISKKVPESVEVKKETKSIFGEGGIYLGEEEVEESRNEREELLSGSKWFAPKSEEKDPVMTKETLVGSSRSQRFERMFSSDLQLENLRPIREVDSKENIPDHLKSPKEFIELPPDSITRSSVIEIQAENGRERNGEDKESVVLQGGSFTSQFSSLPSENSSTRQSPVDFRRSESIEIKERVDQRVRSLSLPARKDSMSSVPGSRSSSFSGIGQNMPSILQSRSESDPGMSGELDTDGFGSQDSMKNRLDPAGRVVEGKSTELRNGSERRIVFPETTSKLGLRERSDSDERRAKNYILDASIASRRARRPRGNTFTLSVSPASYRAGSISSYCESPVVASARDGLGYAAWTTLRKQRTFRKEIDLKIKQSSAVSPYRQIMDRKNYRRGYGSVDFTRVNNHRSVPSSLSQLPYIMSRRHFSNTTSISSAGSDSFTSAAAADSTVNTDDYVGRCIPIRLYEMLKLSPYDYQGSWADNVQQVDEDSGQLNEDFLHFDNRCLQCLSQSKYSSKRSISRKSAKDKEERKSSKNSREKCDTDHPKKKFSTSSLPQIDPESEDRLLVHKECLRLIVNLSSSVASKASQQGLIALKEQYSWAFEDLCVYSQMMDQLATYSFKLSMRRFIQAMFENVSYQTIFYQADVILGRTSDR